MSIASASISAPPAFELAGRPGAPVIVVLGGISADRHVCAGAAAARPGWWDSVAGDGRALDTANFQLLGLDFLDGGQGADGRPERIVTTYDQADAIAGVLDDLRIRQIHALVGASYGGMVGLAFAERYPERLQRLVVIGAAHRAHPMATALRVIQRRMVELGLETGRAHDALVLARGLAMTTYRSAREFAERFDSAPVEQSDGDATFAVEEYLARHGERFAARWAAERFLALSLSGDLHRVEPGAIHTPTLLVAEEGDAIVPREQLEELAAHLGAPTRLIHLASTRGHDAFLTEPVALGNILEVAISTTLVS